MRDYLTGPGCALDGSGTPITNRGGEQSSGYESAQDCVNVPQERAARRLYVMANRLAFNAAISFDEAWARTSAKYPELLNAAARKGGAICNRASVGSGMDLDGEQVLRKLTALVNRQNPALRQSLPPGGHPEVRAFLDARVAGMLPVAAQGFTTDELVALAQQYEPEVFAELQSELQNSAAVPLHRPGNQVNEVFGRWMKDLQAKGKSFGEAWSWMRENQPALWAMASINKMEGRQW